MAIETVAGSLNANFKNVYGSKIFDLVPKTNILFRNELFKFVDKKGREGLQYNQPVVVSLPSSATWGLGGPVLNAVIPMQMQNASVVGSAITTRDLISYDVAARSVGSDAAFEGGVSLVLRMLFEAHSKLAELDLLYGAGPIASGVSLGQSTSIVSSGSNAAITITYGTWAPAIFAGFENAQLDAYQGGTKLNVNGALTLVSINATPANSTVGGSLIVSGVAADITAIIAASGGVAVDLYFYGAYGNNMVGLKGILQNTGTLFGINATTYNLWQSNVFDCGGTELTFAKVQQAVAMAVGRGLQEDTVCLVNPASFADLNNQQAGARFYDESFKSKEAEIGNEALTFWCAAGKIKIMPHIFVHQGEAFIVPPKQVIKVGPLDKVTPTLPGINGEIFFQSPTQAGYEMRLFSDFGLLNQQPAKSVLLKNIVNSQSI